MAKHSKQFVGNLLANCLSRFDHFIGLALKGLNIVSALKYGGSFSKKAFHWRTVFLGKFMVCLLHMGALMIRSCQGGEKVLQTHY